MKEVREFNKGTIDLLLDQINGKELSDYSKTITEEQLKEKISWLRSELNLKTLELANKERYYTDKLENLGQKVEKLKEDRKHLLQDKNAVINLTKAFLDDTIDHTTYEVYGLLQNYYKKLTEINLGSNDSNTKTYLELKHSRDHYKYPSKIKSW